MIKRFISLALISTAVLTGCASTPTGDLYWKSDTGADFNEMKALMDSPEFRAQINDGTHYTIPTCGFADNKNATEILEYLIKIGGAVTSCHSGIYRYFTTPLHEAVKGNSIKNASILLANGADPNIENSDGETPLGIAEEEAYHEIAEMINSYENDWQKAKSDNEINAFKEYLEQYPNALHSDEARLKVALLESMNEPEVNARVVVTEPDAKELQQEQLATEMNQIPKSEESNKPVSKSTVSNAQPIPLEEKKAGGGETQASTQISIPPSPKIDFACTFYSRKQCDEYIMDDKGQIEDMKTLCFQSFGNVEASCRGGAPSCSYSTSWGLKVSYAYNSDNSYFKQSCIDGGGELR
ncbi:ankyrin repeat domain-containing protein [Neptuniibacter marinus]|uniref:ankyrin repeat domain-containing protein n=1 Tax=Neptuniibacter marinus TaxID=1806670 RepID=UPI003B599BF6